MSADVLRRLGDAVGSEATVPPPITRISLDDVPAVMRRPSGQADGKTVTTP
jgi:hypothetical protein